MIVIISRKRIYIITLILFVIIAFGYYIFINKAFDLAQHLLEEGFVEQVEKPDNIEPTPESSESHDIENLPGSERGKQKHEEPARDPAGRAERVEIDNSDKDKVYDISERISFADKRRIIHLVSKKLSSRDINYLLGLFKGGLTPQEKKKALELAFERFTQQEIKEIQALYNKYKKYVD